MAWYRRIGMLLGVALSAGLVFGCSSSAPPPSLPATLPSAATTGDEAAASVSGYTLGPGDQVQVTVFRHEDLSGPFSLDGEGYLALPLVGEILAGGLTARQLENEIEIRLKGGGYLVNPQVGIEVLNYRPFYIIGEVRNPGSFHYVSGMTVINAVDLAGGFTLRPEQYEIIITRGDSDGPRERARPDTEVLPGDIVEVAARFL